MPCRRGGRLPLAHRVLSGQFHKNGHEMKSMDFAAKLGAGPPPHSMCGKELQRRMAAKDTIFMWPYL
jgi:hypothetical protein